MMQPNAICRRSRRRVEFTPSRMPHEFAPAKRAHLSLWLLSLLLALTGCAKLDLGEPFTLWKSEPQPQTPDSLAAVWTETTLHQPGKPVVRGFGGRILFHGSDRQQAVPVEGRVVVYAYDNDRPNPADPAPDKKYVFPADNLTAHRSESSLGPSYNFWLPWDQAGGPQRRISLLTRFEDQSGKIVMSQMAHVTLPGPVAQPPSDAGLSKAPRIDQAPGATLGIQRASYEAPATPAHQAERPQQSPTMRSVTIDVAPRQASRLLSAAGSGTSPQGAQREVGPSPGSNSTEAAAGAGSVSLGPVAPLEPAGQQAAPPAGFAPTQFPAQTASATRPTYDPVRREPRRVESLHRLPPTPRSGWSQPEPTPPPGNASAVR